MDGPTGNITELLLDFGRGNKEAVAQLIPLVYGESARPDSCQVPVESRSSTPGCPPLFSACSSAPSGTPRRVVSPTESGSSTLS